MLMINEIYAAICGESRFSGFPCTLVRLSGCHLRCAWCDSPHSFNGGEPMSAEAILDRVRANGFRTVLVTGGEPLLQKNVVEFLRLLVEDGRTVVLETSGADPSKLVPLAEVPQGVHRIVDVKAPGSGIDPDLIDWEGIALLGAGDEVKIVVAGREDFAWVKQLLQSGRLPATVRVSLSPAAALVDPARLAEWILADGLDVALQIQLHKALWADRERGV